SIRIASEDILGLLYRQEEAAGGVTSTRHSEAPRGLVGLLSRWSLRRKGFVETSAGLALTSRGRTAARNIVRAHRLWESFLEANFDLPADHLHEPAERMEHFVSPELQEQLDQQLAGRQIDPHGKVIPPS